MYWVPGRSVPGKVHETEVHETASPPVTLRDWGDADQECDLDHPYELKTYCEKSKCYLSRNHNYINTIMGMLSEIESSNMLYLKRLPAAYFCIHNPIKVVSQPLRI